MKHIEEYGYNHWSVNLTLNVGDYALIYISGKKRKIRQIYYLMQVVERHYGKVKLKLIRKFTDEERTALSYDKLLYNGLKQGTVNFILNNNKELYEYVLSVIEKKGFYEYKADEESNNYMGIKNIILYWRGRSRKNS